MRKKFRVLIQSEMIQEVPPVPYRVWSEHAVMDRMKKAGFDFNKKIDRVNCPVNGVYWKQEIVKSG